MAQRLDRLFHFAFGLAQHIVDHTICSLDKASGMFAQLYNVRVGLSGGATPPTPLFAATVKRSRFFAFLRVASRIL
jgi:hypothetical protein